MNQAIVPDIQFSREDIEQRLVSQMEAFTPQQRKAAAHLLDNPTEVGVSSVREIANAADVKPNTLIRLAQTLGFEGFEELREPYRDALREEKPTFQDRARWLQSIAKGGRHNRLYGDLAEATIGNLESMFSTVSAEQVKQIADMIVEAKTTYMVGVGVLHPLVQQFAYLAHMALDTVVAVPRDGHLPIDDLVRSGPGDIVLAMSFAGYRSEVVEAVRYASGRGATVIAITDFASSPLVRCADHYVLVGVDSPQFFMSTVAVSALLETLVAFVIADAPSEVLDSIENFHKRRQELGVYWSEEN